MASTTIGVETDDILAALDNAADPVLSTSDVAARLDCEDSAARLGLFCLEDDGTVSSKLIEGEFAWWVSSGSQ